MKEEKINFSSILSQEKSTSSFQCHKLKPKCLFYNIFYDQLSASASWDQSDDSGLTQRITVRRSTKKSRGHEEKVRDQKLRRGRRIRAQQGERRGCH